LIFLICYIQSYFPPERSKKILGRLSAYRCELRRGAFGNGDAVLFLLINPLIYRFYLCGLPVGVTFSFLISTPMVDLGSCSF
jgi:uncharacterized membrane protein YraQ (UPF0718 family)